MTSFDSFALPESLARAVADLGFEQATDIQRSAIPALLEGRDVVFVRTKDGVRAQQVTVGQRSAGRVEILSGLKPGQIVATKNAFLLKAELGKGETEHGH